MFEIPDDDDNFWNDMPLGENVLPTSAGKENQPQLRVPDPPCTGNLAKRLCTDFTRGGRLTPQVERFSPHCGSTSSVGTPRPQGGAGKYEEAPFFIPFSATRTSPASTSCTSFQSGYNHTASPSPDLAPTRSIVDNNGNHLARSDRENVKAVKNIGKEVEDVKNGENKDGCDIRSTGDCVTPKRRRKFPGPAGILPKLGPGKSLDLMSPVALSTTPTVTHQTPQDDSVMLCSQSTDDIFNETPWLTLLKDIGQDGQKLLKKFSISSTFLKAGKKQLYQGKAALIFGVIDTIESHGSEASVTIRDKSGRMQGTIHRDLFKEHESDLQIGTVLVLKQVSIISLSNRNHYLNITPNNVVMLYCGGQGSLRTLKFHGSQDSLHSVLSALEKKAASHRNSSNSVTLTPSSLTGSSRGSLTGSGFGTPQQLFSAPGARPVVNRQPFSPHTPVMNRRSSTSTPVLGSVRDVSVVGRGSAQGYNQSASSTPVQPHPRIGSTTPAQSYSRVGNSTPMQPFSKFGTATPVQQHSQIENSIPVQNNSLSQNSTPNVDLRQGLNSKVNSNDVSVKSEQNQRASLIRTPNSNLTVQPLQTEPNITANSHPMPSSKNNCTSAILKGCGSDNLPIQQQQPVSSAFNTGGKSKWKFKSPPGRGGSVPNSPNITGLPTIISDKNINNNDNNERKPNNSMELGSVIPSVATSVRSVTNNSGISSELGGRSWQLNNDTFGQKKNAETLNNTNNSGSTSVWSFKVSSNQNTVKKSWNEGPKTSSKKPLAEDNLWDDDLSDEVLSQLSEDLT